MTMLALFVSAVVGVTPISDPREWVRLHRPTALTWKSFDTELVKAMRGKAESIGVVYGHFYSEKYVDAALFSMQNGHFVFEIVRCNPVCAVDLSKDVTDGMEGIRVVAKGITYLTVIPAGQLVETTPAIEGEDKHVRLKHDAIQVATFGKAAVVWYWDEKMTRWDTVSTAD